MASTETLIDRIDGFIDRLDEHVTHEDMANALTSLRELVQAGCQHDWRNRVSGGSTCRNCNVWQDMRVFEEAHAPTAVASEDQVQQCDAERNTDHEENETDNGAATGRLGVAGSHTKSMAQAAADGKRAISAGLPHSDVLAVQ